MKVIAAVLFASLAAIVVLAQQPAADCLPPLGAHAPAIFLTALERTTGNPGSRARLNFQIAAPDPITTVAVQIDGADDPQSVFAGTSLANAGGVWFTTPQAGSHDVGLRVTTSAGCQLVRVWSERLVVNSSTPSPEPVTPPIPPIIPDPPPIPIQPAPGQVIVNYDIAYVRYPRGGDTVNQLFPEIFNPTMINPGGDLMLRHPDGSEETLVTGGLGSVETPSVAFDGKSIFYGFCPDLTINIQRAIPYVGCDIYNIVLATRIVTQLTHGEFTPNTGAAPWAFDAQGNAIPQHVTDNVASLGYGIFNLGPTPVSGGKVAFVSSRNGFAPAHGFAGTRLNLQLYVMDEDGSNVTNIAPMNLGSALHPYQLVDGRLAFSTLENQGVRASDAWAYWAIKPDGREWEPIISAFWPSAWHFATQLSGGDIVADNYYFQNNRGFGGLFRVPVPPNPSTQQRRFYPAFVGMNPPLRFTSPDGRPVDMQMPFTPVGMQSVTPFTNPSDGPAPFDTSGRRVGKFTQPSAATNGDLLVVWSPGPANNYLQPVFDAGIYLIPKGQVINSPSALQLVKNDPTYNEMWPRAVVPYKAIYGVDAPAVFPWLPNDGSANPALPAGTPYGIVGTSSFYKRESFPGGVAGLGPSGTKFDGLDAFNSGANAENSNWQYQGADAGKYTNSDICAVRIVTQSPTTNISYGTVGRGLGHGGFIDVASERLKILGEIPLRKFAVDGSPILDIESNPDTSFAATIPADVPFTFQMLDCRGMLLTMAETWHQVRPGEVRWNCGGCHAHSSVPLAMETTAAGKPGFVPTDLTHGAQLLVASHDPVPATTRHVADGIYSVEFTKDIRPILQRSCVPCHNATQAAGRLVLDDTADPPGQYDLPNDYRRLAADGPAKWGIPPLVGAWRGTNQSRYIRAFQSRRSLLIWKLYGLRLDGWTNADHPTETTPGDVTTLPAGANFNDADLDYTGTAMPPPGSVVPPLTDEERLMFVRWIDLGTPIDLQVVTPGTSQVNGWYMDDLRPTLTISSPRPNANGTLTQIRVGLADLESGLDMGSFSVKADVALGGHPAGAELSGFGTFVPQTGIFVVPLQPPLVAATNAHLTVSVRDRQGNTTKQTVRFSVVP